MLVGDEPAVVWAVQGQGQTRTYSRGAGEVNRTIVKIDGAKNRWCGIRGFCGVCLPVPFRYARKSDHLILAVELGEFFLEVFQLRQIVVDDICLVRVALQVVLVVFLGAVKGGERR